MAIPLIRLATAAARDDVGPLIATSVNPRDRFDHQLACFLKWRSFGLQVVSFNTAAECAKLSQAGFPVDGLVEIADGESTLQETGRPLPRVIAVLERALTLRHPWTLVVNGDIFPHCGRDPLPLMSSVGASSCWARRDCQRIDGTDDPTASTYFGGLDAFLFRHDALARLLRHARAIPETASMAFGLPGWDFFAAHLAVRQGAAILEGRFLRHPRHASSYDTLDSFAPLASRMIHSGRYQAADPTSLAAEFKALIGNECRRHEAVARRLDAALSPAPRVQAVPAPANVVSAASDAPERRDWESLWLSHRHMETTATPLAAFIATLTAACSIRRAGHGGWQTRYPGNARHGEHVRLLLGLPDEQRRHRELLQLLGRDLLEHGVLNLQLLKYVAACCEHRLEEQALAALLSTLKEAHDQDAAAA